METQFQYNWAACKIQKLYTHFSLVLPAKRTEIHELGVHEVLEHFFKKLFKRV